MISKKDNLKKLILKGIIYKYFMHIHLHKPRNNYSNSSAYDLIKTYLHSSFHLLYDTHFKRNNYLILIETYAKDLEYEKKKISEITNSEEVGLSVTVDTYGYCDDVDNVELIAYIVPVNKDNTSKNTKINVSYNMINDIKCNVE